MPAVDDEQEKVRLFVKRGAPVVYYAQSAHDGSIKIGTTKDIHGRLLMLWDEGKPRELLAIEPGSYDLEKQRHDLFKDYWIAPDRRGAGRELFEPGEPLIEHINNLLMNPHHSLTVPRHADTGWATMVTLDARVSQPDYRPPLRVRASESVQDRLYALSGRVDVSVDDLVEDALVRYLDESVVEGKTVLNVPVRPSVFGTIHRMADRRGKSVESIVEGLIQELDLIEREDRRERRAKLGAENDAVREQLIAEYAEERRLRDLEQQRAWCPPTAHQALDLTRDQVMCLIRKGLGPASRIRVDLMADPVDERALARLSQLHDLAQA